MGSYKKDRPITQALSAADLVSQLGRLGVKDGMILEVHSSLSSIGYVIGGAETAVDALMETVGEQGTLVVPLQVSSNSEPASWSNPPLARNLWDKLRENTPGFDPLASEYDYMGSIPRNLARRPGCLFSSHPSCAFGAWGKYAKMITHRQPLDFALSEQSPLGQLYQLPSYILLIGVGYERCTGMHLAEYRSNVRPVMLTGGAVRSGQQRWRKYLEIDLNSDEFAEIGAAMEEKKMVTVGHVGSAVSRLFKFSEAVDFATSYLQKKYLDSGNTEDENDS